MPYARSVSCKSRQWSDRENNYVGHTDFMGLKITSIEGNIIEDPDC